ncbi:MAG: metallophosphoesterase [Deltaproteobacteria bacterium]|nr:metallophosphoesterase [Deltaproteobacteria bacterium]
MEKLIHLSDLHIGRSPIDAQRARAFVHAATVSGAEHVIVTGDLTHRGRHEELAKFREIFEPLAESGRLSMIPGNHDRLGDDLRDEIMWGPRVQAERREGMYLVRVDSTGPHNRSWLTGHGSLAERDLQEIDDALGAAPAGNLVVLALHHHLLPLPLDHAAELVPSWLGHKAWTAEIDSGYHLIRSTLGRCDLVLHGHRHIDREIVLQSDSIRPLRIFNAGSSTEQGRMRMFSHKNGHMIGQPRWLRASPSYTADRNGARDARTLGSMM